MNKRWITTLTLTGVLMLSGSALAGHDDHGHGHGKGNPHARPDDDQWEQRGNYEYHVFEGGSRPPGWGKGKKTGWRNCGMPPGQAKKYGCQTYVYEGRHYYYYRDDAGRVYVRRPTIHIDINIQ